MAVTTEAHLTDRSPWPRAPAARTASGLSAALVAVSATAAAFTLFAEGILSGPAVSIGSARGTALVVLAVAGAVPVALYARALERR